VDGGQNFNYFEFFCVQTVKKHLAVVALTRQRESIKMRHMAIDRLCQASGDT
jgi:hypothetical protein